MAILARELVDTSGVMKIDGMDACDPFNHEKGGKQGGVETSDSFNVYLEEALHEVVVYWKAWGMGFKRDALHINHAIWAENIILLAGNQQLEAMVTGLSMAITRAKLE